MATGISTPITGTSTPARKISHPLHDQPLAEPQVTPAKEDDTSALEAMRAGKPYIAGDAYLDKLRNHALALLQKGNMELDMGRRMAMWNGFLDLRYQDRKRIFIAAPFLCEYVSVVGRRKRLAWAVRETEAAARPCLSETDAGAW